MTLVVSSSPYATISKPRNPWVRCPGLPRHARAVLAALHFAEPDFTILADLSREEWRDALLFAHSGTVGLDLRRAARGAMPAWVRDELDGCAARNAERARRLRAIYTEMRERLEARTIPFVALKGFTHAPLFGCEAEERQQCDVDLYVPPARALAARDMFLEWGYEPWEGLEGLPTDHLPAMIRKTGWEWRGDHFDIEMPFAVEVHTRFWNERLHCLPAPENENFWHRRQSRICGGVELPALTPHDALGYASLHLLKHLFQGAVRASHVLEIARFLQSHSAGEAFWREWLAMHPPGLRRLETVGFRLAQSWFGCDMGEAVEAEIETLPEAAQSWFEEFAHSPMLQSHHPNKDELWLHLSLLESRADAVRVARRRLFPLRIPGPVTAICMPASEMTFTRKMKQQAERAVFIAGRARRHAVTLPRVIATGAQWWFGAPYWTFLFAAALFNFGLFIFVLLYNLLLLDIGYREDFIGTVSGAATIGTMAGALPAAWALRRFGLRRSLFATIGLAVIVVGLRANAHAPAALIFLACAWGLVFSVWAVILAPAIAASVPEKRRPAAFSVFFACMVSVGIVGNWIGGRLPLWLHGKQPVLFLATTLVAAALIPAWRWRPSSRTTDEPTGRIWPRGAFMKRYLAAYAIWQLATGAFNPFQSVYFAHLGYSAAHIGSLLSGTQAAQVGSFLLAPLFIRRAGLTRAIVWMMAGTALGLLSLGAGFRGATGAVVSFVWYVSLQWMSEPGLNTLLMNNVSEAERTGASSLNYLVAFAAQAIAAFAAGRLVATAGYTPIFAVAGGLALIAAMMFRYLVR